ncbi:trypsin-like peptidase domain-containing protein [bacterium AH-315-O15]|nr:trypsin-like peptidase domain-containing protein [bacterium AH-315-O15]
MLNIHRCVVGAVAALLVSGLAGAQTPTPSPAPPAALRPAEIIQASLPATVFIEIKTASGTEAFGSGFIIDPAGIILTNLHVIRGAVSANVSLQNGDVFDRITVRVVDEARDIAIIQVPGFNLPTVQLADSDTVMQGDSVVLLGSPLGLSGSGTTGIVSAIRTFEGSRVFQTDAAANPGNSGGPMLNEQGAAVGILTFGFEQGENLNFVVPVNYARGLLDINDEMSLATLAANYPETVPDTRPPQPVVAPVVEPPDAAVIAPVAQAPPNADDEPTSITAA